MRKSILSMLLVLAACGGSGGAPANEPSSGGEVASTPPPAVPEEFEAEEAFEAPPSGPAKLLVRVEVDGRETPAEVAVLEGSRVVMKARSGAPLSLEAGRYLLQVRIDDPSVLVDKPSRSSTVVLDPGEEAETTVEFGRSRVRLRVERNGKPVRNARVVLKREASDEVVLDYSPSEEHVAISSGRYEAVVHFPDGSEAPVSGLVFMPGATQDVPIRVK